MSNKHGLEKIQGNIKELQCAMVVDLHGNILECFPSESFFNEMISFDGLEYVARIVSLRFHIVDFHKILHGLEITINVFSDHIMAVTSLNENILVVLVRKDANQAEICNTVLQVTKRIQDCQTIFRKERKEAAESFEYGKKIGR